MRFPTLAAPLLVTEGYGYPIQNTAKARRNNGTNNARRVSFALGRYAQGTSETRVKQNSLRVYPWVLSEDESLHSGAIQCLAKTGQSQWPRWPRTSGTLLTGPVSSRTGRNARPVLPPNGSK